MSDPLKCPQCGGELTPASGERVVRCRYCDGTLWVDRGGLVSHYSLPWLLDQNAAGAALRRWMAGNQTVKDLDQKSTLTGLERTAFPMWLFRFETPRGEAVVVEPAAPTPNALVADLQVPAGKLEPYHEAAAGVAATAATVPLETARGWVGERLATQRNDGGRLVENALVEVPLWHCAYTYGGASYTALVDGSTGAVLASVFPAKRESPFIGVAALGLVLFLVAGLAFSNPLLKLASYAVIAAPLFGLAYVIARKV
jgi:hypothetical protein